MNAEDLQEVEITIEDCKLAIELSDTLKRLQGNKDYIKIFEEMYFTEQACSLVGYRGNPAINDKTREVILRDIDGIGSLQNFLNKVIEAGKSAKEELSRNENTREEILEEGI